MKFFHIGYENFKIPAVSLPVWGSSRTFQNSSKFLAFSDKGGPEEGLERNKIGWGVEGSVLHCKYNFGAHEWRDMVE